MLLGLFTPLKKIDLIALLFIKLYYNENFENDFLEMAFWRMCPFSIKCLNSYWSTLYIYETGNPKLINSDAETLHDTTSKIAIVKTLHEASEVARQIGAIVLPLRSGGTARKPYYRRSV